MMLNHCIDEEKPMFISWFRGHILIVEVYLINSLITKYGITYLFNILTLVVSQHVTYVELECGDLKFSQRKFYK